MGTVKASLSALVVISFLVSTAVYKEFGNSGLQVYFTIYSRSISLFFKSHFGKIHNWGLDFKGSSVQHWYHTTSKARVSSSIFTHYPHLQYTHMCILLGMIQAHYIVCITKTTHRYKISKSARVSAADWIGI